jgi:hypothetical protein
MDHSTKQKQSLPLLIQPLAVHAREMAIQAARPDPARPDKKHARWYRARHGTSCCRAVLTPCFVPSRQSRHGTRGLVFEPGQPEKHARDKLVRPARGPVQMIKEEQERREKVWQGQRREPGAEAAAAARSRLAPGVPVAMQCHIRGALERSQSQQPAAHSHGDAGDR